MDDARVFVSHFEAWCCIYRTSITYHELGCDDWCTHKPSTLTTYCKLSAMRLVSDSALTIYDILMHTMGR
ncbi:hypothetical protein BDR03DRAFT_962760 [Suillus americanus]|nr:hypothetical protein BDR03DRAFT_962760 [Suillus americanus]